MSGKRLYMTRERARVIQRAFKKWYNGFNKNDRGKALEKLGPDYGPRDAYWWKVGKLTPPPVALRHLYLLTGIEAFLLTREEKDRFKSRYRDGPYDNPDWPDLAGDGEKADNTPAHPLVTGTERSDNQGKKTAPAKEEDEILSILAGIHRLISGIGVLSNLPAGDARRENARKMLVGPSMHLFRVATALDLEYPQEFRDLLDQLDFAATALKKPRRREKKS